ncbi:MAG: MGMT family protein [Acidobacteriota bacterium]
MGRTLERNSEAAPRVTGPSASRSLRRGRGKTSPSRRTFFQQVYRVVGTIPPAHVLTYGQIASLLGAPYLARQVGWAMHGCPPGLPWQRVIGAGGRILINSLSGAGPLRQRQLLEQEGVQFVGDRVDMQAHQFFPDKLKRLRKKLSKERRSASPRGKSAPFSRRRMNIR